MNKIYGIEFKERNSRKIVTQTINIGECYILYHVFTT